MVKFGLFRQGNDKPSAHLPVSRWEEDSEEEDKDCEEGDRKSAGGAGGGGSGRRGDNAIFRRAISAIKPKSIEIKLRPERRVLLDQQQQQGVIVNQDVVVAASAAVAATAAPLVETSGASGGKSRVLDRSKFNPLADLKASVQLAADDKKKSVRDRLGDKVVADSFTGAGAGGGGGSDQSEKDVKDGDQRDKTKDKDKEATRRDKTKTTSPSSNKEKVTRRLEGVKNSQQL